MSRFGCIVLVATIVILAASFAVAQDKAGGKWATIKGQIVVDKMPEPEQIDVPNNHPDQKLCLKNGKIFREQWVVNKKNNGLKNVFVWIKPANATLSEPFPQILIHPKLLKPAKDTVEIDQPCCQFIPHSVGVRVGQTLVIKNSAPAVHNAKYDFEEPDNGNKNPIIQPGDKHEVKIKVFETGVTPLSCNIHPWMSAQIRIFDHPYFAITDDDGKSRTCRRASRECSSRMTRVSRTAKRGERARRLTSTMTWSICP
jgi:plastocyanin